MENDVDKDFEIRRIHKSMCKGRRLQNIEDLVKDIKDRHLMIEE